MDERIKAVIAASPEDPIHNLAAEVNLSIPHLRQLFRREMGMPLGKYRRLVRMERAKRLVEESFLTIKQITYEIGLKDETHFIREFKRYFGTTPMAYRSTQCEVRSKKPTYR